ncbi:hypothetical protein BC829DRAFT_164716 [Chytridium lagenaria]|nr:hypothetical protein BC829DRAFT_164716 [Chytridium lagenaria]
MSSLAFSEELGPPPGGLQKDTSPKPHSQWQPALTHIHSSPNALSSPNLPPLPPPASSLNVSAGLPSGVSPALRHASDLFLHHTSSPHILIQSNSIASLNKSFTRHPLLSPPAGARSTDISIPSGFSSRDLQNLWDEEAKMDPAVLSQEERDRDKDRLIAERNATHGKLGDGSKSGTSSKKGAASTGTINQEQIALRRRPAFISTVLSMHAIVHRKLYKATGLSVEVYFKNTWKVSRAQVYRLLDCASVLKQLECFPIEQQPHRERICRTLKRLSRNTVEMHALWRTVLTLRRID